MWDEFVVGFSPCFEGFPPSTKINISKFQFHRDKGPADVASCLNFIFIIIIIIIIIIINNIIIIINNIIIIIVLPFL